MVAYLKNLEIREVSLVDAGANPGARVVLFKRDGGPDPVSPSPTLDATLSALRGDLVTLIERVPPAKQLAEIDAIVSELRAILAPITTPAQAIIAAKREPPADGFLDLAKRLVAGEPVPLTRAQVYTELRKRASAGRREGESDHQAFARFAETTPEGRALMQAHRLASGADDDTGPVAPAPAMPPTTLALNRLRALAEEERARHPEITREKAMANAMATPEGLRLYREHRGELLARRHA